MPCAQNIAVRWRWYYYACPLFWALNGLATSQYGDVTSSLETYDGLQVLLNEFLRSSLGFHFSPRPAGTVCWTCKGISRSSWCSWINQDLRWSVWKAFLIRWGRLKLNLLKCGHCGEVWSWLKMANRRNRLTV